MGTIARKINGMSSVQQQVADKVADSAAAGSAFLAGAAWVADVEPIITAVAGLVAIFAGAAAAWYHIERAILMHRQNASARLAEKIDALKEELKEIKEEVVEFAPEIVVVCHVLLGLADGVVLFQHA